MGSKFHSWDLLLLLLLLVTRARVDTLSELVFPADWHRENLARLPGVAAWLEALGPGRFFDWPTDLTLLLPISLAFGVLGLYWWADARWAERCPATARRAKLALVGLAVLLMVVLPTVRLVALRAVAGPASYTHDGGVIQTEAAVAYALAGRSPYVEDYVDTPMAEWGIEYHTALYHYPYGPWTFLFPAPFYALLDALLGWYDQRVVYLLVFALILWLAAGLNRHPRGGPALVMLLGLNPIMGSDVAFGQNDVFVLFWVVWALWLLQRRRFGWAAVSVGLACASKPTAWFLLPFYALYLAQEAVPGEPRRWAERLAQAARRGWPAAVVFLALMLPYFVWSPAAMWDDIWGWSSGTADVPYQVRGWGLSTVLLGLGLIPDRLAYFPFWAPQLLVCGPLLVGLLRRQARQNDLANVCLGYGALLFAFLYLSRFFNENYLGYLLAVMALGVLMGYKEDGESGGGALSAEAGPTLRRNS
ncbi:MAG: DUF2029 domain-containing protein [Chloroflexi bacterium]|nr:DUF2029 domain-containing protein [Chloroflexota bacterium]